MGKLRKILEISTRDRLLLLETALLLSAIRLSLWLLPFKIWRPFLEQPKADVPTQPSKILVGRISWAVNVISSQMPGGVKCLARALATHILMSKYGHPSKFKIGVAKGTEGNLEAHAWIENMDGKVVMGRLNDLDRYLPLPSLQALKSF